MTYQGNIISVSKSPQIHSSHGQRANWGTENNLIIPLIDYHFAYLWPHTSHGCSDELKGRTADSFDENVGTFRLLSSWETMRNMFVSAFCCVCVGEHVWMRESFYTCTCVLMVTMTVRVIQIFRWHAGGCFRLVRSWKTSCMQHGNDWYLDL